MFETKGDLPEWRLIYDHVKGMSIGDTVTYADLDGILGREFTNSRSPLYDAITHMEENDSRTLANVKNVGYRLARAVEHEDLARHHHKKSRRSMRRASSKIRSADRSQLNPEARRRFDAIQAQLEQATTMIRRLDARVTDIAAARGATKQPAAPDLRVVRDGEHDDKSQTA